MGVEKYAVYVKCVNCLYMGEMEIYTSVRVSSASCPRCHCDTLTAVERTESDKRDGG